MTNTTEKIGREFDYLNLKPQKSTMLIFFKILSNDEVGKEREVTT